MIALSRKLPIFYSALLLTAVNLLLRLVGTSFQVYLSSRIGAEGIGLLQLVMSVGSMAMVAGMGGIRTASMYLTAEEIGRKKPENLTWVLSGCALYSILFSGTVAVAVQILAPVIAEHWIGNSQTVNALRLFAAFLPVNCLTGVMVGYFTGSNRIGTLAAVETAEQLFTMVCTIALLSIWAGQNAVRSCEAVVMGSGFGSCLTLCALVTLCLLEKPRTGPRIPLRRRLCQTALPLAVADDLRTGISTVENLMVPKRLALYPGTISPLAAFGTVCGMVFPILMFPAAILYGLTELLIPELARCNAAASRQRISHLVQKALRVGLMYGTLCAGIMFLAAPELCAALYGSAEAGRYLRWFAPMAVMLYCDAVIDAMIKGLGQQQASVRYNITTNTMDILLLYILLPKYGIAGYFTSFLVTHAINLVLSLRRLLKITGETVSIRTPLLTGAAAMAAVWVAGFLAEPMLRCGAYVLVITSLLFLLNILSKEDILWLKGLVNKK